MTPTQTTLTPAERLVVRTWFQILNENRDWGSVVVPDERYSPIDYAVAQDLGMTVERVGDALVAAGKRPPVWWVG